MSAVIDGKAFAGTLREKIVREVAELREAHGLVLGLAVVLVGQNPASWIYVRSKVFQRKAAGIESFKHKLPESTPQAA